MTQTAWSAQVLQLNEPRGSGVLIGPELLLTCAHVVLQKPEREVPPRADTFTTGAWRAVFRTMNGEPKYAITGLADAASWMPGGMDLVLLRVRRLDQEVPEAECGSHVDVSGPLIALGYPLRSRQQTSLRVVLGAPSSPLLQQLDLTMPTSYNIEQGHSGGAVFDEASGRVVGLLAMRAAREHAERTGHMVPLAAVPHASVSSRLASVSSAIMAPAGRGELEEHRGSPLLSPPSRFAGQAAALQQLSDLATVAAGEPSLSTSVKLGPSIGLVTGQAGLGKTALVRYFGHTSEHLFPDGLFELNLRSDAALGSATPLLEMLRALGLPLARLPSGVEGQSALLSKHLRDRHVFILLDDVTDETQVRPLTVAGPGCMIVITSRKELDLPEATPIVLPLMSEADGRQLIVRAIGEGRADDEVSIAELTRLCGHLPLALHVAAARLAGQQRWSVSDFCAALRDEENRLAQLRFGRTSVEAVFSVAYSMLAADQALVFRVLAQLPGVDASAELVAEVAELSPSRTARALQVLNAHHLAQELSPGRFSQHELLRLFARNLRRKASSQRSRHHKERAIRWYGTRAATLSAALDLEELRGGLDLEEAGLGHDGLEAAGIPPKALAFFSREKVNLIAAANEALLWAPDAGPDEDFARLASAIAVGVQRYCSVVGYVPELLDAHLVARKAAEVLKDDLRRAEAILGLGDAYRKQSLSRPAETHLMQALQLFRSLDDKPGEVQALLLLGHLAREHNRHSDALRFYRSAESQALAIDHPAALVAARNNTASVYIAAGDYEAAWHANAQAVDALVHVIDRTPALRTAYLEAWVLFNRGRLLQEGDELEDARQVFLQSLNRFRFLGSVYGMGYVLGRLGELERRAARLHEATVYLGQSAEAARAVGDILGLTSALGRLADLRVQQGDVISALALYQDAQSVLAGTAYTREQAAVAQNIERCKVLVQRGRSLQAEVQGPKSAENRC